MTKRKKTMFFKQKKIENTKRYSHQNMTAKTLITAGTEEDNEDIIGDIIDDEKG